MKKLVAIMCLFSLSVFAENSKDNNDNNNKQKDNKQSNVNSSTGAQTVQYCNMPKEITIKNECKPVVKQKVVYKNKIVYKERIIYVDKIVYKKKPTKIVIKEVIKEVEKPILKNALRLLGGYGPTGVSAEKVGNRAIAFEKDGAVFGLGYTRRLSRRWSIEGNILTNETYLLGLGLSF